MTGDAQLMTQARAAGRLAGQANREHGTLPVPPASVTDGSLLARRAAVQWYRGLAEGRESAGDHAEADQSQGQDMTLNDPDDGQGAPAGDAARLAGRRGLDWDPVEYITRLAPAGQDGPGGEDDGPQLCQACGHLNPPGALFCSQCGEMLPDDDEGDEDGSGDDGDGENPGMARFNPAEARLPAGAAGGGQFGAGGAGAAKAPAAKPAAAGGAKQAPPPGTARERAEKKASLLKQAKADREKAEALGHQVQALVHQQKEQADAAKTAAAATKKATADAKTSKVVNAAKTAGKTAAPKKATVKKTKRAATLASRITHIRGQIKDLNTKATQLTAQAAKL